MEKLRWRKSSWSSTSISCVEIGCSSQSIGIRDTKNRSGGMLQVDRSAFAAFVASVKADRLR
ncbi:hypothetical protein BKA25_001274 [Actinoalloteichus hymeniacidonis]|uniref:DUF397 family protein n=2 Tax=Actinoalloteichus hymeniacidonis TaxID=340345 RepID=A0AAC9N0D2_9PSEU|nr:DUF397 domain-containing protein [Actinoalloteichus hymeniacidonis]AOS64967.1 putative DUF397 family protein [Actinoalloteichus hymeniacidonis]MBB5906958.1 hypothetical protein [Actinoalloteichus hymeniacidonis]